MAECLADRNKGRREKKNADWLTGRMESISSRTRAITDPDTTARLDTPTKMQESAFCKHIAAIMYSVRTLVGLILSLSTSSWPGRRCPGALDFILEKFVRKLEIRFPPVHPVQRIKVSVGTWTGRCRRHKLTRWIRSRRSGMSLVQTPR